MSADNCLPRCSGRRDTALAEERARVDAAYGTKPLHEFDNMRAALAAHVTAAPKQTFEEYYEFYGVEDGVLHVTYSGKCHTCGLTFTHKSEHPIPLDGD